MSEGSYSVEAAFIMPVLFLFTLGFLFFGFYLRDIVFVEAFSRSLLLDNKDNNVYRDAELKEELNECLWCSDIKEFIIYEKDKEIVVQYRIGFNAGLFNPETENEIVCENKEKTSEKILRWSVYIDTAGELFLTEE